MPNDQYPPIIWETVTSLDDCRRLWQQFTPAQTLFDDWEFRYAFQRYHQHPMRFVTARINDTVVGFLALQHNQTTGLYEFWGGDYMEDNRALVLPDHDWVIPHLYNAVPRPHALRYITGTDAFTTNLSKADNKYLLPLKKYSSYHEYLADKFSPDTRRNILSQERKVQRMGVAIEKNTMTDIELLIEYNLAQFGNDSSFASRPHHQEIFRELITLPSAQLFLHTYTIEGKREAVSLAMVYNGVYEFILAGINPDAPRNTFKLVNLHNIETAIQAGAHTFDAMVGSYGWKEQWHFDKIPQYYFE